MLGTADRSYSTTGLRREQQFDAWRSIVADTFVPVALDSGVAEAPDGFLAECQVRLVGDLAVSWLRAAPQEVRRTARQAASAPGGVYFLNLALGSGTAVRQDDRTADLRPGDFVIVDGDRPFQMDFPAAFEQISLMIPKSALDEALVDARSATAVTVPGDQGIGAIAAGAVASLAGHRGRLVGRTAEAVALHVVGLLAAAIGERMPEPQPRRAALFRLLLEDIDRHLGDPDLRLQDAARRIAISPSYATKLFAENRTSFEDVVLGRRLDRAWTLLPQAPWSRSVTDIAMECGFRDSGYFARAFRARFGTTPTARRYGR